MVWENFVIIVKFSMLLLYNSQNLQSYTAMSISFKEILLKKEYHHAI